VENQRILQIHSQINSSLERFLTEQVNRINDIDVYLKPVASSLSDFVRDGGKRFRPIFSYLGYLGAGGQGSDAAIQVSSSLELVHACALIHDDLMDGSDSRRGKPSLHKYFEDLHSKSKYLGKPEKFGAAAAILIGDLALSWSDQMIYETDSDSLNLGAALPIFYEMRSELMAGQYLDVLEGVIAKSDTNRSRKIAQYKSGKYSIERPLQFGGALAGANSKILESYSEYGLPLGEAFQLRDDILGIFGKSDVTGKPSGDDIREGKRTLLIAMTLEGCNPVQKSKIENSLGKSDLSDSEVTSIQEIIVESGALASCEALIENLHARAIQAIQNSDIEAEVIELLKFMATAATKREK